MKQQWPTKRETQKESPKSKGTKERQGIIKNKDVEGKKVGIERTVKKQQALGKEREKKCNEDCKVKQMQKEN